MFLSEKTILFMDKSLDHLPKNIDILGTFLWKKNNYATSLSI